MFAWLRVMSADTAATIPGRSLPWTMRQAWSVRRWGLWAAIPSILPCSGRMPRPARSSALAAGIGRSAPTIVNPLRIGSGRMP